MKPLPLLAALFLGSPGLAQEPGPSLFPSGYPDHHALSEAIAKVAADHPGAIRVRSLAKTAQGRDVWLASLGRPDGQAPALLLVANLEADHVIGSAVALRLIEWLAANPEAKPVLDRVTIHVVPRLDSDGAERVLANTPRSSFRLNLSPLDRDRDGKFNEDGPDDLDGDGLTTRMRVKDEAASMIPDPKEPRSLRKADPSKWEAGEVSEYVEGKDNDGDGLIGEDPPGGVNLNRNWPVGWKEFDPEAGWSPVSEPETNALIAFAFDHPEIAAVWTFALHDNLEKEPKKPGSSLDDKDLPLVSEFVKLYKTLATVPLPPASPETSPATPAVAPPVPPVALLEYPNGPKPTVATSPPPVSLEGTTDGAMSEWAYQQFGVIGLSSRLWSLPELPEPAKDAQDNRDAKDTKDATTPPKDGDARWFFWNDKVMGGRAFVPFHPFNHPELGMVEIGGWKPGVRVNPPAERIGPIADANRAFLIDLSQKLPRIELRDLKAEPKGAGVFEVSATVANEGFLPTALAQGIKTRTASPVLVKIKGAGVKLLSGKPIEKIETLAGSGGHASYRWLVLVPSGTKAVNVEASCPKGGRVEKSVELK